jgi:hypothetical protein
VRARPQVEVDALVRDAGFVKVRQWSDDAGITTVSLALKGRAA